MQCQSMFKISKLSLNWSQISSLRKKWHKLDDTISSYWCSKFRKITCWIWFLEPFLFALRHCEFNQICINTKNVVRRKCWINIIYLITVYLSSREIYMLYVNAAKISETADSTFFHYLCNGEKNDGISQKFYYYMSHRFKWQFWLWHFNII